MKSDTLHMTYRGTPQAHAIIARTRANKRLLQPRQEWAGLCCIHRCLGNSTAATGWIRQIGAAMRLMTALLRQMPLGVSPMTGCPAFQIVEYEITDPAGFQTYIKSAGAIHSSRVFLARHAKGTSLSGEPPKWIGILQYPSLADALAFDSSSEHTALKPICDISTKWRSFVVEGLPN